MGLKRKAAALAASLLVGIGIILFAAAPAQAQIGATSQVRNWATGRCLDSNWNGNVYTLGCNWGNYQNWFIVPLGGDWVAFRNNQTNRCLNVSAQGNVSTQTCTYSEGQRWWRGGDSVVASYLNYSGGVGRCLDSNHAGAVYAIGCNGGGYQDWREGF